MKKIPTTGNTGCRKNLDVKRLRIILDFWKNFCYTLGTVKKKGNSKND